jgi:hypothetical protein
MKRCPGISSELSGRAEQSRAKQLMALAWLVVCGADNRAREMRKWATQPEKGVCVSMCGGLQRRRKRHTQRASDSDRQEEHRRTLGDFGWVADGLAVLEFGVAYGGENGGNPDG